MKNIILEPAPWKKTDLKFGLIGLGKIMANAEIPAYKLGGYNITCAADISDEARDRAKTEWGISEVYDNWEKMLDSRKIDILNVAVAAEAADLRIKITKEAASRGIHLMMQKPLNISLDLCGEMVEIAEKAGIKLCVNHNSRWAPVFYGIKQILDSGRAGKVENITIEGRVAAPDGEIIRNFSIHNYDIIGWWMQKSPKNVKAYINKRKNGKRFVTTVFEYGDGTISTCNDSSFFSDEFLWKVRIETDKGVINGSQLWCREQGTNSLTFWDAESKKKTNLCPDYHYVPEGFLYSMNELVCSVEENREPMTSGRETLKTMELLFRVMDSVK